MSQLLVALWLLCGALVFLPLGTALVFARRRFGLVHSVNNLDLVATVPASGDASVSDGAAAAPSGMTGLAGNRLLRALTYVALYAVFVFGALCYSPAFLSRVLHTPYPMAAVTSSSMWPALHKGDLVVLQGVGSLDDLSVGDIIAFRHEDGFAIHRIAKIEGDRITTKGDANSMEDPAIGIQDVVGRVFKLGGSLVRVPYVGNLPLLLHRTSEATPSEAPPVFEGQTPDPGDAGN
jgi:signal peptidase I